MGMVVVIAIVIGLLVAGFGLHRLLIWAEGRGWIFYRTKGKGGAGSIAMLELAAIFEPEVEHVVEQGYTDRAVRETFEVGGDPLPADPEA